MYKANKKFVIYTIIFVIILVVFAGDDAFARMSFRERLAGIFQNKKSERSKISTKKDITGTILVDGRERTYIAHLPPSYNRTRSIPAVFVFHGGFGNAENARKMSKMNQVADKNEFIAVYPNGSGKRKDKFLTWNDGFLDSYAKKQEINDVKFFNELLEKLKKDYNINGEKIYVTGISNGGIMAYRLVCEVPGKIKAIAPVASSMVGFLEKDSFIKPTPVIIFHGLEDKNLPYDGGIGEKGFAKYEYPSVYENVNFWIQKNGLSSEPVRRGRIGRAVFEEYGNDGEKKVVLWTLEDGGHTWPGGSRDLPERVTGKVNTDISASEIMWEFFKKN